MENKRQLIYIDDAKRATEHYDPAFVCVIDNVPLADAVEVVRCYQCRHSKEYQCRVDPMYNHLLCYKDDVTVRFVEDDFFCAYGERKDESA